MKINKDLVDAIMMLSFIGLVLIGTSEFSHEALKHTALGGFGLIAIASIVLRVIALRQPPEEPEWPEYPS